MIGMRRCNGLTVNNCWEEHSKGNTLHEQRMHYCDDENTFSDVPVVLSGELDLPLNMQRTPGLKLSSVTGNRPSQHAPEVHL